MASELNLRFGANYPEWIIREHLLNESIPDFDRWKDPDGIVW